MTSTQKRVFAQSTKRVFFIFGANTKFQGTGIQSGTTISFVSMISACNFPEESSRNSSWNASKESTSKHTVNQANTTTAITADTPDLSMLGPTVSVTATVAGFPTGVLTPTGTVTIFEGVASSGIAKKNGVGTYCAITLDVNGTGSCNMTFLSGGVKTITALYNPANTADFSTSSDTESHTVNNAPVANAQSVSTAEDTAKAITLTATDADSGTLTYFGRRGAFAWRPDRQRSCSDIHPRRQLQRLRLLHLQSQRRHAEQCNRYREHHCDSGRTHPVRHIPATHPTVTSQL